MRQQAAAATGARVVLGGKTHSFSGFFPGILEEVLLSIDAGHAVYVLGGFGGAAHLVAMALDRGRPSELARAWQHGARGLADANGLNEEENLFSLVLRASMQPSTSS
jgi:hypothetical protein